MAQKRMFAMTIVDSDAFLDMPLSAQALYFHLNMRADDDGFVGNPKKIMRNVGAAEDDLRLLIAKKFLITFDNGVIVIKHWRIHNTLSAGRYHETSYVSEKDMLKLKRNNAYTLNDGKEIDDEKLIEMSKRQVDEQKTNKRRTLDEQKTNSDIDIDKNKIREDIDLDKDLDKEKIKDKREEKETRHRFGEYGHVLLTDRQILKLNADYGEEATKQAIKKVDEYCQQYGKRYTDYNLTLRKWGYDGIVTKKTTGQSDLDEWAARKERERDERK